MNLQALTVLLSFTVEEVRALMDKVTNVRNMSVIAHGMVDLRFYMAAANRDHQSIMVNLR
jgi:hypothetical protein